MLATVLGAEVCPGVVPPSSAVPEPVLIDASFHEGSVRVTASAVVAQLEIDGVARVLVERGESITVEAFEEAAPEVVAMWLRGTVAAVVLGQQGRFALHAATVIIDGRAVAIAGPSGAGKSTTALSFMVRGHRLLADDVSPVRVGPDGGRPVVDVSDRPIHVGVDAADRLGIDIDGAARAPLSDKAMLPAPLGDPAELHELVVLAVRSPSATASAASDVPTVIVRPIDRSRAAVVAHRQLYRTALVRGIWPAESWAHAATIAATVPVRRISRAEGAWSLDEVIAAVATPALLAAD